MSVQGSINTVLGVAAAGKKLDQVSKGLKPTTGAANNTTPAMQKQQSPLNTPIPTFNEQALTTAQDQLKKNIGTRRTQSKNWRNRQAALRERKSKDAEGGIK